MKRKKPLAPKFKVEATAKAEVVAKATYQRKRTTTVVIPPDVTRARTAAWLDIISPITEWAALKGDALWYRRQQLRIQQEAALDRLASVIQRKMNGKRVLQPLPPKMLVPVLEGASLEDADSPLIEWWANLLVSSATGTAVRPYSVDLMKAIGPEEASYLNEIWEAFSGNEDFCSGQIDAGRRTVFEFKGWFEEKLIKLGGQEFSLRKCLDCFGESFQEFGVKSSKNGVLVELSLIGRRSKSLPVHAPTMVSSSALLQDSIPLEVCFALKLLEEHEDFMEIDIARHRILMPKEFEPSIGIRAVYPSKLGVEFLRACNPAS